MASKKVKHRQKSKSGKFKTIYHLLETLFAKNKELTSEQAMKHVKREFPGSAYIKKNHFPWYKTHIVSHQEFRFTTPPSWVVGPRAKVI